MTEKILKGNVTGVIAALFVCALWGSLFPMIKVSYTAFEMNANDIPAILLFAGVRFFVSGILIFLFRSVKRKRADVPKRKNFGMIFWVALTAIVFHYSFTYIALSLGQGSKSAIVKQVGFLFLGCFAFLFDKEDRFSVSKMISGALGFLGIVVISFDGSSFSFGPGDALLVLASLSSVASMLFSKRAVQTMHPASLTASSQFLGGVILCIAALFIGGSISHFSLFSFLVFCYICIASILAYTLWNMLMKYQSLSKLSVIKFTEPVFAVIFSGILLGEDMLKPTYIIAMGIVFVSVLISNKPLEGDKK